MTFKAGGCIGQIVGKDDAVMHRAAPRTTKNYLAPHVHSAEMENPVLDGRWIFEGYPGSEQAMETADSKHVVKVKNETVE